MNPNTLVFTKKEFIDNLKELIDDDEIILATQNIEGTLEVKKKKKIIPFGFVASAFKQPDGVGDIYFGKIIPFGFCICKKEFISKETIAAVSGPRTKKPIINH